MESILSEKETILLIKEQERKDIIVGSPHHTPGGVAKMPCKDHEVGDENTGFITYKLAEKLKTSFIIACNYHIDSNKNLETVYSRQIKQWKPKYLIEIHGHGGKKAGLDCIEISSGNDRRNDKSKNFAQILKKKLDNYKELKKYEVDGDFDCIYFKATSSATITTDLWIPFHIELPPSIRKDNNDLPAFIDDFVNCLKETIEEVCE
jgi:hypothetical protein